MYADKWMIYGAYGFTGRLILKEALRRGHKPILAGRSPVKLLPLAKRFELEAVIVDLHDADALRRATSGVALVLNAAGPFVHTSAPLVEACLESGTHYLDIAGEVMVFESLLALDRQANMREIAVIPGVGFNVLATDCLAKYAIERLENPMYLEIATSWVSDQFSTGSYNTMIEGFPIGPLIRRAGQLVPVSVRKGRRTVRFLDLEREVVPASLGDLSTAFVGYKIPNIKTYTALPEGMSEMYAFSEPIYRKLFANRTVRRIAKALAGRSVGKFNGHETDLAPSQAWIRVSNADDGEFLAGLETAESYRFTAAASVRGIEKVFAESPTGALIPAQAFGKDFVLEVPGTKRVDLPEVI